MKAWAAERDGVVVIETTHAKRKVVATQVQMLKMLHPTARWRVIPVAVFRASRTTTKADKDV